MWLFAEYQNSKKKKLSKNTLSMTIQALNNLALGFYLSYENARIFYF